MRPQAPVRLTYDAYGSFVRHDGEWYHYRETAYGDTAVLENERHTVRLPLGNNVQKVVRTWNELPKDVWLKIKSGWINHQHALNGVLFSEVLMISDTKPEEKKLILADAPEGSFVKVKGNHVWSRVGLQKMGLITTWPCGYGYKDLPPETEVEKIISKWEDIPREWYVKTHGWERMSRVAVPDLSKISAISETSPFKKYRGAELGSWIRVKISDDAMKSYPKFVNNSWYQVTMLYSTCVGIALGMGDKRMLVHLEEIMEVSKTKPEEKMKKEYITIPPEEAAIGDQMFSLGCWCTIVGFNQKGEALLYGRSHVYQVEEVRREKKTTPISKEAFAGLKEGMWFLSGDKNYGGGLLRPEIRHKWMEIQSVKIGCIISYGCHWYNSEMVDWSATNPMRPKPSAIPVITDEHKGHWIMVEGYGWCQVYSKGRPSEIWARVDRGYTKKVLQQEITGYSATEPNTVKFSGSAGPQTLPRHTYEIGDWVTHHYWKDFKQIVDWKDNDPKKESFCIEKGGVGYNIAGIKEHKKSAFPEWPTNIPEVFTQEHVGGWVFIEEKWRQIISVDIPETCLMVARTTDGDTGRFCWVHVKAFSKYEPTFKLDVSDFNSPKASEPFDAYNPTGWVNVDGEWRKILDANHTSDQLCVQFPFGPNWIDRKKIGAYSSTDPKDLPRVINTVVPKVFTKDHVGHWIRISNKNRAPHDHRSFWNKWVQITGIPYKGNVHIQDNGDQWSIPHSWVIEYSETKPDLPEECFMDSFCPIPLSAAKVGDMVRVGKPGGWYPILEVGKTPNGLIKFKVDGGWKEDNEDNNLRARCNIKNKENLMNVTAEEIGKIDAPVRKAAAKAVKEAKDKKEQERLERVISELVDHKERYLVQREELDKNIKEIDEKLSAAGYPPADEK